jgi:tRNA-specific 2-thiouridylase
VLGTLRADQLAGAVFPVGVSTKAEVRAEAAARGLLVSDKPDSYDVCFAGQDTAGFLRTALGSQPGPIVDREGTVVGAHDGAYAFTVGQRRGVPLGGGTREPRYVLSVEPVSRTVVVGSRDDLAVTSLVCTDSTYLGGARTCEVQLRAHATPIGATVTADGDALVIDLHEPAYGIAPGQAAVLYDDDAVLGGAWITATA